MNSTLKSLLFWFVLVVILALIWNFSTFPSSSKDMAFSDFVASVNKGDVAAVTFVGKEITGRKTTDDLLRHIFERFCIGK